jgi:hypothetical protein
MDYFKHKAFSASMLKRYLLGCKFGQMEVEETEAMTFGSAFHALMAGEHEKIAIFKDEVACRWICRDPKVKAPRATNRYKEMKAQFDKKNEGKHIVTDSDYKQIEMLRDVVYADPTISKIVNLEGAEGEKEFYKNDLLMFGEVIEAKAKMDLTVVGKSAWVLDWKKVAVAPTPHNIRRRIMYEFHEDLQAFWYHAIYQQTYGVAPALLWVFIMDKPPYEYLTVDMSDFIQSGAEKAEKALKNIRTGQTFRTMYGDEFGICRLKREFTDL